MKAAILTALGAPLELATLTMPERLACGQVHVKLQYSGICGAQLGEIDGVKGPDKFLPHCLGHEGVGEVVAIGEGVKTVAVGNTVVLHWRPSDGMQSDPPVYDWDGKQVNAGWVTTFQEEAIVSENRVTRLPDGINPRFAPLFGCALTTAYGVVTRDADVKPGQSVLVFGCGGVGLAIIQMAAIVGAWPIAFVDPVTSKERMALASGALYSAVFEQWERRSFDVVIDTTGKSEVIERAYGLTAKHGKTILVGVPKHNDPITIDSLPLHFGKMLTGSEGGSSKPHEDIPRLVKLVQADKLKLDGLITHEYPFAQVNEAIALVRSGEAGRVLLRMES
jgi:S-(hydroxymethyl)glutathione dehydrogenase / alcohol dehydrogenase